MHYCVKQFPLLQHVTLLCTLRLKNELLKISVAGTSRNNLCPWITVFHMHLSFIWWNLYLSFLKGPWKINDECGKTIVAGKLFIWETYRDQSLWMILAWKQCTWEQWIDVSLYCMLLLKSAHTTMCTVHIASCFKINILVVGDCKCSPDGKLPLHCRHGFGLGSLGKVTCIWLWPKSLLFGGTGKPLLPSTVQKLPV
jgi:hypothetical protein